MIKSILSCCVLLLLGSNLVSGQMQKRSFSQDFAQMAYAKSDKNSYHQDTDKRKISLVTFLKEVEEIFSVRFIYENKILQNKEVNADWKHQNSLEKTLADYLYPQGLQYKQLDKKQVIVFPLQKTVSGIPTSVPRTDFSFPGSLGALTNPVQQPLEIVGQVTDSTGAPLTGVSVTLKSNQLVGTTTDLNGRYVLVVPEREAGRAVLVFSMVGFGQQEVVVNQQNKINVVLFSTMSQLDEAVVIAFGRKQKKESVVGAITTINPDDLKIPASNLTTALGGRAAGIIAFQRTGEPGEDNANFFIRGGTSFGYKVDPLILIDNIESSTTDLARLQVDDIESFSVLKDATATAVYGARGANGVLLITTKEGREGKVSVSLRVENSLSSPTRKVEIADPVTYMRMANEAVLGRDPLGTIPYEQSKIENTAAGSDPLLYPMVDWRKELLKDFAMNQRMNLSVRGGGKVARYFVSGGFNQDNGVLKVPHRSNFNNNINLKSYSLRGNIDISPTKSTNLGVRLSGSFDDYNGPINGGSQVYHDIMRTPPSLFLPFYPPGETYKFLKHIMFGNYGSGNYLNPYADMVKGYKQYSRSNMQAQLELNQNLSFITKGLNFTMRATTSRYGYFDIARKYNPFYYQLMGLDPNGNLSYNLLNENTGTEFLDYSEDNKNLNSVFFLQSILDYKKSIGKSNISGMLVSMARSELTGNAGSLQQSLAHRNLGVSGRFTYDYKTRYFFEFNFGYNGSERFDKNHRFGFFPSFGVAWNVFKEDFWKTVEPVVSNFRIKATYGLIGNDEIGSPTQRFFYLSEVNMNASERGWSFGYNLDNTENGINVTRYSNSDITWETGFKSDIGVEFTLLNKLEIAADYFHEVRKNIFMQRSDIPTSMGLTANVYANVGKAMGQDVDISANYQTNLYNGSWIKGMANFTYATSKYLFYEEPDYQYPWLYRTGYPINISRGYIAERLFIDEKDVYNSPEQQLGGEVMPGDIKYLDVNGDGKITSLDRVPIGQPTVPEINFGFGVSMGHKRFDFSVFFEGLACESFFINPSAISPFRSYVYSGDGSGSAIVQNQVLQVVADNYWSESNRDLYAFYPRLSWINGNPNNEVTSTWWMRDGSFIRLKQLEVGYSFENTGILKKADVKNMRIYANGSNLLTLSKFNLWDVEMGSNGLAYPIQRVFNVGIKLNF